MPFPVRRASTSSRMRAWGGRIIKSRHFNVIIEIDPDRFPLGILLGRRRQGPHRRQFGREKEVPAADAEAAHDGAVHRPNPAAPGSRSPRHRCSWTPRGRRRTTPPISPDGRWRKTIGARSTPPRATPRRRPRPSPRLCRALPEQVGVPAGNSHPGAERDRAFELIRTLIGKVRFAPI